MQEIKSFFENLIQKISTGDIQNTLHDILTSISIQIGLGYTGTQLVVISLLTYLFFLLLLVVIHRLLLKKLQRIQENCSEQYDKLWYEVSLVMYAFNQEEKAKGKENKLVYGAKSIISLEKNDYISNKKKIFQDIQKFETYIGKKVISDELIQTIGKLHRRMGKTTTTQTVLGWILTVLTLGIYKLVW